MNRKGIIFPGINPAKGSGIAAFTARFAVLCLFVILSLPVVSPASVWITNKATMTWSDGIGLYYVYSNSVQTQIYGSSPTWAVIDDFDNDGDQSDQAGVPDSQWFTSDSSVYSYPISTFSRSGSYSLKIVYDKAGDSQSDYSYATLNSGDLANMVDNVSDFSISASSSICAWVYSEDQNVSILAKLDDGDGTADDQIDLQTVSTKRYGQWEKLQWTWDSVDLKSCDISRIRQVYFFIAPGDSSETGTIYLDDFALEDASADNAEALGFSATASTAVLQVDLVWPGAVDPDRDLAAYDLYRATYSFSSSSASGLSLVVSTTSRYYSDTVGFAFGTTYYYALKARDSSGLVSSLTGRVSAVTREGPKPAAPSDFTVTAVSTDWIRWEWQDNSSNEVGFKVYSSTGGLLKTLGGNTEYWIETGLAANTSYYRTVKSYNSNGTSGGASGTGWSGATAPSGLTVDAVYVSSLTVSWTASSAGTYYGLSYSRDNYYSDLSTAADFSDQLAGLSYTIEGMQQYTTYWLRAWAYNPAGFESGYISASTRTLQVPLPGAVSIDRSEYYTWASSIAVTVDDYDRNTDSSLQDTISVSLSSDDDLAGFSFTLLENGNDSGIFVSTVAVYISSYTMSSEYRIKALDGSGVYISYTDIYPPGSSTATATFYSLDNSGTGIVLEQNPPGTADIIRGYSNSVDGSVTIQVYDANGALLNQVYTTAGSDGSFTLSLGDNQDLGGTPDPDTGIITIYVATPNTLPANRLMLTNDVKCVVKTPKISFETKPWGEGIDYLVGTAGAMEPGAAVDVSASAFEDMPASSMLTVNGQSTAANSDGSFRVAVGDEYVKYSNVSLQFTDSALNLASYAVSAAGAEDYLLQNAPNPFRVGVDVFTVINYGISSASDVKLYIYNIAGELVKKLVDEEKTAGRYKVKWYGDNGEPGDDTGNRVGSGVYIYIMESDSHSDTGRMILIR
jgi:hypothetical protein